MTDSQESLFDFTTRVIPAKAGIQRSKITTNVHYYYKEVDHYLLQINKEIVLETSYQPELTGN